MNKKIAFILIILITSVAYADEYKMEYEGTVYLTKMIDTNVNVREFPTTDAHKIDKYYLDDKIRITGISKKRETIDNHSGYWLRVNKIEKGNSKLYPTYSGYGWIWSKYVEGVSKLEPSEITFKRYIKKTNKTGASIILNIKHKGKIREVKVYPHKEKNQDYYTFIWSEDMKDFIYYDIPGTYIWDPKDNSINHITYFGSETESAWCIFTDDRKYMLQDYGTSPGIRGVSVIEISTGKKIYGGGYIYPLNLEGYKIDISFLESNPNIDNETLQHVKTYKKNNAPPESNYNLDSEVVIKYRYDFITQKRKFIECYYKYVQ